MRPPYIRFMKRIAFKMKIFDGVADEYKRRHDEIWPKLKDALKAAGVSQYSIFLDESTGDLFATLYLQNEQKFAELPNLPIMKEWWNYMKDIMETNADHSPISTPLREVF